LDLARPNALRISPALIRYRLVMRRRGPSGCSVVLRLTESRSGVRIALRWRRRPRDARVAPFAFAARTPRQCSATSFDAIGAQPRGSPEPSRAIRRLRSDASTGIRDPQHNRACHWRVQEWPDMCCGSEPASDARGVSSKNIAERGDRGVGDWDPRRASENEVLGAMFFRVVERFAGAIRVRPVAASSTCGQGRHTLCSN
jgi:hypothetical protein